LQQALKDSKQVSFQFKIDFLTRVFFIGASILLGPFFCSQASAQEEGQGQVQISQEQQKVLKNLNPEDFGLLNSLKMVATGPSDELLQGYDSLSDLLFNALKVFRELPYEQVMDSVKTATAPTWLGGFLQKNPKGYEFLTKLLRNEEAIPQVVKVITDRAKFYFFIGIVVITFFMGWILKNTGKKKRKTFSAMAKGWVGRFFLVNGVRLSGFIIIFSEEIAPTWQVIKEVYFS
jgi:hypothetical protein